MAFSEYTPKTIGALDTSSLGDMYVSYRRVNVPEVTVPTYDDTIAPLAMLAQGSFTKAVDNIKTKFSESPIFKFQYTSSGVTTTTSKDNKSQASTAKKTPSMDRDTWKSQLYAAYKRAGCSDQFARNLIGKNALETRYGEATAGTYNYGNIKDLSKEKSNSTQAYDKVEKSNDYYVNYNSIDDFVEAELKLLKDPKKYNITGTETPQEFAQKLKSGGYATDPNYVEKVVNTIKSI